MKQRAISTQMMTDLLTGKLSPLHQAVLRDDTLCLELRGTSINIYYRGGSMFRVTERANGYDLNFNTGYCTCRQLPEHPGIQEAVEKIPQYKQEMDAYFHKVHGYEREFQQMISRINNRTGDLSRSTDYYIADLEFMDTEDLKARFDMIGVKWLSKGADRKNLSKPSLSLMELKFGDGSLGDAAGIEKHLQDLNAVLSNQNKVTGLAQNMTEVFRQKCRLGLIDGLQEKQYDITITPENPEVLFIFAEHDPDKSELGRILSNIHPEDYAFPIHIAASSAVGYGLFANRFLTISEFLSK